MLEPALLCTCTTASIAYHFLQVKQLFLSRTQLSFALDHGKQLDCSQFHGLSGDVERTFSASSVEHFNFRGFTSPATHGFQVIDESLLYMKNDDRWIAGCCFKSYRSREGMPWAKER